ncbi:DUF4212 domain-containing protein [Bauldia sp.]|uniref:DUF4212 domain-containing protein n=1 Tax=Bauldia sp. TaxID=2575872 RepID=UPI003BA8772B
MPDTGQSGRWRETGLVGLAVLVIAALVTLFFLTLANPAEATEGYATGFVLAAVVSPAFLIGILFWFARRQDAIDRKHGMFED